MLASVILLTLQTIRAAEFGAVSCEGTYPHHLQGVCTDDRNAIFLDSGHTHLGMQTAAFADGRWWFGCYGKPAVLLEAVAGLKKVERFGFDCSLGIVPVGGGKFLVARGTSTKDKGHTGRLVPADADMERGLKVVAVPAPKK